MKPLDATHEPRTRNYEGVISIPFYIEEALNAEEVENLINEALDKFGKFNLGRMSWDNPEFTYTELDI